MPEYGRFTIHGDPIGEGGKALDRNFITTADTLKAIEETTGQLSDTIASLSTDVAWLEDAAEQLTITGASLSGTAVSLSNVVGALGTMLSELDADLLSASGLQTSLSNQVESIVARRLPLSAIVYVSGNTFRAQRGDTHGVIAEGTSAAAVLQSALNHVATVGGCLYICPGVYPLTATVSLSDASQTIEIAGTNASRITAGSATLGTMLQFSNCASVAIRDIVIDGSKNTASVHNRVGLSFVNCAEIEVSNCTIRDVPGHGVVATNDDTAKTPRFTMTGCNVRGMFGSGVAIGDRIDGILVAGCIMNNNCNRADLYPGGCADIWLSPTSQGGYISRAVIADNVIANSGSQWLGNAWPKRQLLMLAGYTLPGDVECAHVLARMHGYNVYPNSTESSIRFTLADGKTLIPHSVRQFVGWGGGLDRFCDFTLRVPKVYAGAVMPIYMYWATESMSSAAAPVYGSKYAGVWHMYQPAGGTAINDAGPYARTGTKKSANEPVNVASMPIAGQQFDGVDDFISISNVAGLTSISALTVGATVVPQPVTGGGTVFSIEATNAYPAILFWNQNWKFSFQTMLQLYQGGNPVGYPIEAYVDTGPSYSAGVPHQVVGRVYPEGDAAWLDIFVDGNFAGSASYAQSGYQVRLFWGPPVQRMFMGTAYLPVEGPFKGIIDEVFLYGDKMDISRLRVEHSKEGATYHDAFESKGIQDRVANVGTGRAETAAAIFVRSTDPATTIPGVVIAGNIISGVGGNAIVLDATTKATVKANVLSNCAGNAILVSNSSHIALSDNVVNGCANNGYDIPAALAVRNSNDCLIVGNVMRSNGGPSALIIGSRCVASDNCTDYNCIYGELSGSVTAVGSNTTITVTGLPPNATITGRGYAVNDEVVVVWLHDDTRMESAMSIVSINDTAGSMVLSGVRTGLTSGVPVWVTRKARRADIVVAGDKCYVNHNIIRVPGTPGAPGFHHFSNAYSAGVSGTLVKLSDNDFITGDDVSESYAASVNLVGTGHIVTGNRGYS